MVKLSHIPNAITSIRLLLVVPIAFFIAEESHCIALILFAVSGLSDGLDGFLARQFGWVSTFGRLIDPLADKLMMVTTTIVLGVLDHFPIMLMLLIVTKDLAILGGVFSYTSLAGFPKIQPNLLGKLTTAVQIILIAMVLVDLCMANILHDQLFVSWYWLVAVITAFDGVYYLGIWTARLADDPRWKETM